MAIGDRDFNIEFNDSVLETKGWRSNRYDGRQLKASKINEFTNGDVSFSTTPLVSNVSRNIYIGSMVVDSNDQNILTPLQSSSYVVVEKYITINDDNTMTEVNLSQDNRVGFERSFLEDFEEGTKCQVISMENEPNNLKDSYEVLFNGGLLEKQIYFDNSVVNDAGVGTSEATDRFDYARHTASDTTAIDCSLFQTQTLQSWFRQAVQASTLDTLLDLDNFFNQLNSSIDSQNSYFATFVSSSLGNNLAIKETYEGNIGDWSTAKLKKSTKNDLDNRKLNVNSKYSFQKVYNAVDDNEFFSYYISKSTKPAVLLPLQKTEDLPNGLDKTFVLIPHNIHKHVLNNLGYFLNLAGITEAKNTTIQSSNQNLI